MGTSQNWLVRMLTTTSRMRKAPMPRTSPLFPAVVRPR